MSRKRNKNGANSPRRIKSKQKQAKALQLRLSGCDYEEIAKIVGYKNRGAAYNAIKRALEETVKEPAEEVREIELKRVDAMWSSLWSITYDPEGNEKIGSAPNPDDFKDHHTYKKCRAGWEEKRLKAYDTLIKLQKRRSELLGLDAPKKVESETKTEIQNIGKPPISINIDLDKTSDKDLDNLLKKLDS